MSGCSFSLRLNPKYDLGPSPTTKHTQKNLRDLVSPLVYVVLNESESMLYVPLTEIFHEFSLRRLAWGSSSYVPPPNMQNQK